MDKVNKHDHTWCDLQLSKVGLCPSHDMLTPIDKEVSVAIQRLCYISTYKGITMFVPSLFGTNEFSSKFDC